MSILLSIFWFAWEIKYILFWLYWWQLKEYHFGRFADHFRTHKGKQLIFNIEQALKLAAFLFLAFKIGPADFFIYFLALVYMAEALFFGKALLYKTFKKPVLTPKIIFLSAISFAVLLAFSFVTFMLDGTNQALAVVLFDLLTVFIISAVVLFFQPVFVFFRKRTIKKASVKLQKIKELSNLTVVAITGSYGKTSTKEFLATILAQNPPAGGKVLKTKEHQNSEIGIANCILNNLKPSHKIFIAEVGAYNKGKVKEVCHMLKPKIGIVTGVNEQHLSLFGSMENLLSAEGGGELEAVLPQDGVLLTNGDNKYCLKLWLKSNKNKKIYSAKEGVDADLRSESITVFKNKISFVAIEKNGNMAHFEAKVLGTHSVQNLLAAILAARTLGMTLEEISQACRHIQQEQSGMDVKPGKHNINIIDSSYSSNPDGVFADLDYLNIFEGKKAIVMPCLIELGAQSGHIHEKIGRKIAETCNLAVITTKDKFAHIKAGAMAGGMDEKNIVLCDKPEEIYSLITLLCKSGDAVLLEGRVPEKLTKMLIQ